METHEKWFNQWKIEQVKIRINWIQNEPIFQNPDAFTTIGTTVSVVLDQYGCASLKNTHKKKGQKRKINNIKKKKNQKFDDWIAS